MITSSSESRLNFVWDANAAKLSDSFERCFQVASDYYYYFIYSHISIIIIIITSIIIIIIISITIIIIVTILLLLLLIILLLLLLSLLEVKFPYDLVCSSLGSVGRSVCQVSSFTSHAPIGELDIIVIILTLDIALSLQLPTNKIYDMKFGKY